MVIDRDQAEKDAWQAAFHDTIYEFVEALRRLHEKNPWPESPVVSNAMDMLATELWDRCFSVSEITAALRSAAANLPRYAGGDELRP